MARKSIGHGSDFVQGLFEQQSGLKQVLEALVNSAMQEELEKYLRAGRNERVESRLGYRNGSKGRRLRTRVGELELSVPQVRGCEAYHPSMFSKWQRSERALMVACAEMYYQGVSTRQVQGCFSGCAAGRSPRAR